MLKLAHHILAHQNFFLFLKKIFFFVTFGNCIIYLAIQKQHSQSDNTLNLETTLFIMHMHICIVTGEVLPCTICKLSLIFKIPFPFAKRLTSFRSFSSCPSLEFP
uniref:Uncharacterized protein n=1 Tax=Arundo donax TaxID=35708 RepID=A0A0A8XR95_ARUDO